MDARTLARAHGLFNVVTGTWPIVHMSSFEAVLGPKTDRWLVRTVGGLLVTGGLVQLTTASDPAALAQTRKAGLAIAGTLAAIDVVYGVPGRISRMYLLDAVAQGSWVAAWLGSRA